MPLAALLLALPGPVVAQAYPTIVDIAFEGNEVTRPGVMLRELVVRVGEPAEPAALERSRQALLDLGLFRRVHLREEPADGGVRIIYEVDERYYFLPLPRGDIKSDGRYAYGAQLRWDNVAGLNQSLRVFVEQEDEQRQGIGRETSFVAGYGMPFFLGSPYNFGIGAGYSTRPVQGEAGDYTETFRNVSVRGSRTYSDGPASQGLTVGSGLSWRQQRTSGQFAEPAYGDALAPAVFVSHRDFHNRIYSDVGSIWRLSVDGAHDGWGSDYSYVNVEGAWVRQVAVGRAQHQTLHLRAFTGMYFDGPDGVRQYGLGGASFLRGYDSNFIEGNAYYYVTAELARPIGWRWLRAVVIAEAGNVFARPADVDFERVYGSLGAGVRVRFSHFVDFEVELGYSIPLDGGSGKVFASRV